MNLFGDCYLSIRNEFVIPLVNYGILRSKYQHWSLKEVITNNAISLNKLSGKAIEIEIDKANYYKALHCDIEMFMNKSIIQYSDFIKSSANSPCWSFVTLYYLAFFTTTCFLRFLNKGFMFLSFEQKKKLEDFSLAVYSTPISLDSGNYYFNLKEENPTGNLIISLSFKGDSVHKSSWIQLESTFREFIPKCDADETAIYTSFLNFFSSFKTEFPSNLRNKLNYNGESSILDIEAAIDYVDLNKIGNNFAKSLFSIDTTLTINNQISSIAHLLTYLFKLNNKLYSEYFERSRYGKYFQKERFNFLRSRNIAFA